MNSCLMLGLSVWTGIDLSAVFQPEDLVTQGIERDPHITVLYSEGKEVPITDMTGIMSTILGKSEWEELLSAFRSQTPKKIIDHFSLGLFEGDDRDHLVLRLQDDSPLYNTLQILHTGLKARYKVKTKFPEYKPHMTLATLEKGKAKEYMFNSVLGLILEKATFTVDDFIMSYGKTDEPEDRKKYQITTENAVTRYFRQLRAVKDGDYYDTL